MMAYHESDGMVQEWTSRCLLCRYCGFDYDNIKNQEPYCPACGSEEFDILEEYYG